jgi:hypothetical protein
MSAMLTWPSTSTPRDVWAAGGTVLVIRRNSTRAFEARDEWEADPASRWSRRHAGLRSKAGGFAHFLPVSALDRGLHGLRLHAVDATDTPLDPDLAAQLQATMAKTGAFQPTRAQLDLFNQTRRPPDAAAFARLQLNRWVASYNEGDAVADAPELELTFGTEPIVGWRAWRVVTFQRRDGTSEPRLAPLYDPITWRPRQRVEAICNRRGGELHEAPWPTCQCGIWALPERDAAERLVGSASDEVAFGPVALWGRVLEFERGYRAQYAYPRKLYLYKDAEAGLAGRLQKAYGVPALRLAATRETTETESITVSFSIGPTATQASDTAQAGLTGLALMGAAADKAAHAFHALSAAIAATAAGQTDEAEMTTRARRVRPPRPRPTLKDALRRRSLPPALA